MKVNRSWMRVATISGLLLALTATMAGAGIHTWDVNEVYSDASGEIQFVELWEAGGGAGETGVGNGTVSTNSNTFNMSEGAVAPPTSNKFFLLGTAAFAALPGAPTPDAIIPAGMLPFFFDPAGDTVAFGGFDSWATGTVPTNGTDSLDRINGVGPNSPTNYLGTTGSVTAPVASVPSASNPMIAFIVIALAGLGSATLLRLRQVRTDA